MPGADFSKQLQHNHQHTFNILYSKMETTTILIALTALAAGTSAGYLWGRRRTDDVRRELEEERRRADRAETALEAAQAATLKEREQSDRMLSQLRQNFTAEREALRADFQRFAVETVRTESELMQKAGTEQTRHLFAPVHEELERMRKSVQEVRLSGVQQHTALEKAMENMMQQTREIGREAADLTRALRSGGKVQGDWGEQLLESILENSGLRRDEEYIVQASTHDEEGNRLRPDVVVLCPGDRKIIIDSKVSLTAYATYVAAESEADMQRAAQDNLRSLRRHIDELAGKDYEKLFGGTLSHVLMFVPNEGSYILALRSDPQLGAYAYRKRVLLINPTNLMMSLQLIHNLWQSERQAQGIEEIVRKSSDLYDKFVGFLEKFNRVDSALASARTTFDEARAQLHTGRGNIVRRLEDLKQHGVNPKKKIPIELTEE